MNRFFFDTDDDGHWYLIPTSRRLEFNGVMSQARKTDNWDDFIDKFSEFRTHRHINHYEFKNPEVKQ